MIENPGCLDINSNIMAGIPISASTIPHPSPSSFIMAVKQTQPYPQPLKKSGALDKFEQEDTTPVIGREFLNVNIVDDLLTGENSDELLRDLAITSGFSFP